MTEKHAPTATDAALDDRLPPDECPACGLRQEAPVVFGGPDRLHGLPGTFNVALCPACGTGRTLPPVSTAELGAFYPGGYYAYDLERGLVGATRTVVQRLRFRHALRQMPYNALVDKAPGPLLDVGCGRGDFGAALVAQGWDVAGLDPSEHACAVARRRGVRAEVGTLATAPFERESFAAVVMNHSLEHVVRPRADLARVYELLRPGGVLTIALPNFASWQRRRFGNRWFALDLPRHRTHFVPRSLRGALEDAGFTVSAVGSAGGAGLAVASVQYRWAGRLVLTGATGFIAMYVMAILLTPFMSLVDHVDGEGPILYAVAYRPE